MKKLYLLSVLALASCGYVYGAAVQAAGAIEEYSVEKLREMSARLDGAVTEEERKNVMTENGQADEVLVHYLVFLSALKTDPADAERARLAQEILRKSHDLSQD